MKELKMPQNSPSHPLPQWASCGNHMWGGWEEGFSRWALPPSILSAMCLQPLRQDSELGWLPLTAGVMSKVEKTPRSYKHLFAWKAITALDLSVDHPSSFHSYSKQFTSILALENRRAKRGLTFGSSSKLKWASLDRLHIEQDLWVWQITSCTLG